MSINQAVVYTLIDNADMQDDEDAFVWALVRRHAGGPVAATWAHVLPGSRDDGQQQLQIFGVTNEAEILTQQRYLARNDSRHRLQQWGQQPDIPVIQGLPAGEKLRVWEAVPQTAPATSAARRRAVPPQPFAAPPVQQPAAVLSDDLPPHLRQQIFGPAWSQGPAPPQPQLAQQAAVAALSTGGRSLKREQSAYQGAASHDSGRSVRARHATHQSLNSNVRFSMLTRTCVARTGPRVAFLCKNRARSKVVHPVSCH